MGDYHQSIKWHKESVKVDPSDSEGYCGLGDSYNELHDYAQATKRYTEALEKDPQNTNAYYGLGRVYEDLGDYNKAVNLYKEIVRIRPKAYGGYDSLARVYAKQAKYDEAVLFYNKAIEEDNLIVCYYTDLGLLYKKLGKSQDAEKNLLAVVKIEPYNYVGYYNLARYYYEIGKLVLARQNIDKALSLVMNPFDKIKYLQLEGFIMIMQEDHLQAEAIFRKQLKEQGADPVILAGLGHIAYAKNDYQSAKKYFEEAVKQPGKDSLDTGPASDRAMAFLGLGWVNASEHKYKEAIVCYENTLKEQPLNTLALISMGDAYRQLGDLNKAEEYFRKVSEMNPS
jgi:tetratricopeptide (TPR) repeat protein